MTDARTPAPERRTDLDGLRGLAALLVAVYHVWSTRVSGGVDVFLFFTGFFITASLLRSIEREGRVPFARFWSRLVRRLSPAAGAVLLAVAAATPVLLPRPAWRQVSEEVAASALYFENWKLAANAVDYLGSVSQASPVQHFWSLAVQGQFYLLWPVVAALAALAAARTRAGARIGARPLMAGAAAVVFAASLAYSVQATAADQRWAYFDTGARLWELALGALLAAVLPWVRPPARLRAVMGWTGVAALVACGAVLDAGRMFPGWIALWPVLAAALVVVAGAGGAPPRGAGALLELPPLRRLGALAYPFYLWHWPVLIFFLAATGRDQAGPLGGALVLVLAYALAAATERVLDGGVLRRLPARPGPGFAAATGAAFLVPVLALVPVWQARLAAGQERLAEQAADFGSYPGARVVDDARLAASLPELPVYPDLTDPVDPWLTHTNGCNAELTDRELVVCGFGPESAGRTVAMVGDSHVGQWFPALLEVAERRGWRLEVMTKNGCAFSTEPRPGGGEAAGSCEEWKAQVDEELRSAPPDAVFTNGTRSVVPGEPGAERVPEGYLARWEEMGDLGVGVIAVRDTPRLDFDAPECVDTEGRAACGVDQGETLAPHSPLEELGGRLPPGVAAVDMTGHLCPEGRCPSVMGNVLVMGDDDHMTATFSRSLAPALEAALPEDPGSIAAPAGGAAGADPR
ncbi:acyltransferase family protein [Nocardiopsis sp. RSe5-2]|uniref:Acyltransferase family protein n=1 Tax=Nocardiopsis endophytica TaxID=3018445 RepID=A0ABT4U6V6_9ACTN|nr:acyltransferase family protein [Nocardiopsis endophytica]MDA2812684.1 acyltransferase family protein [Nocardiopsis endophytica]